MVVTAKCTTVKCIEKIQTCIEYTSQLEGFISAVEFIDTYLNHVSCHLLSCQHLFLIIYYLLSVSIQVIAWNSDVFIFVVKKFALELQNISVVYKSMSVH